MSTAKAEAAANRARLQHDWPVGLRVEVLQEDNEHFGAWFAGSVVGHEPPSNLTVAYEELFPDEEPAEGEEDSGLVAPAATRNVRPVPPTTPEGWASRIAVGDIVQLDYIGGCALHADAHAHAHADARMHMRTGHA